LKNLDYFRPSSLNELKKLLTTKKKNTHILAGGTDLLVKIRHKAIDTECLIDIKQIKTLSKISVTSKKITIGATVTLNELAYSEDIIKYFPALAAGALSVGSTQIRNRATLAGNLCNSSPVADTVPALLIYNASIKIISNDKERTSSIHEFITGVGKNNLRSNEIVKEIVIDIPKKSKSAFLKNARRKALDLSSVNIAAGIFGPKDIRIAIGSCSPIVKRAKAAEEFLIKNGITKKNIKEASKKIQIKPISDLRGSKDFRQKIAERYFIKLLNNLSEVK